MPQRLTQGVAGTPERIILCGRMCRKRALNGTYVPPCYVSVVASGARAIRADAVEFYLGGKYCEIPDFVQREQRSEVPVEDIRDPAALYTVAVGVRNGARIEARVAAEKVQAADYAVIGKLPQHERRGFSRRITSKSSEAVG